MTHPVAAVYVDGSSNKPQKGQIRAVWRERVAVILVDADELRAMTTVAARAFLIAGILWFVDLADTTSADDGTTVLVSADGYRYKPLAEAVADFVLKAGDTMTGALVMAGLAPEFKWFESDAGADEKRWKMQASGETFVGRASNDAENAGTNWLEVTRTGTVIDLIKLLAKLELTGVIELGHASDTTLSRHAAGVMAVEGVPIYPGIPTNAQSANYTFTLSDAYKKILHPSSDTTARTYTCPANASVAYPLDTVITVVNQNGAGVITIGINADTMRLAGTGATGNRTLAANGIATLMKLSATEWIISGVGLT